jgi:hypothetical protein
LASAENWGLGAAHARDKLVMMSRRLPLTRFSLPRTPTVDALRKRLGGRASTQRGAGDIVLLVTEGGVERPGVVLFVEGDLLFVWIAEGIVRKAHRGAVRPGWNAHLAQLAADARVFADLHEGEDVRYQKDDGDLGEGVLVEKCRFGALVIRPDGTVMGVGFRRLWPVASSPGPVAAN